MKTAKTGTGTGTGTGEIPPPPPPGGEGGDAFRFRFRIRAMTLLELLVAFFVLLLLVGALVALSTRSLEVWTSGEARKELYDKAEVVLSTLAKDLRNVYIENEVFSNGTRDLPPPALQCDLDRQKNPRLRFVRTGAPAVVRAQGGAGSAQTVIAPTYYGPTWEVAYVMDPDPAKAVL